MKTYLSVCSGIEAATLAWHPFGWRAWAYAEVEPFPSYVLNHHYGSGRPHTMPDPGAPDIDDDERKLRLANIKAVSGLQKTEFGSNSAPNLGDMTNFQEWPDAVFDVLCGGTPCQSYSVAGLGAGLDDPRGDLMLTYVAIARRYRPSWVVWENVPGVLSNDGGRAFGTLLGLLTGKRVEVPAGGWETAGALEGYKSAYGVAWRVIDSQFVRVDGFERAVPQRRRRVFVVGYLGDWRRAAAVLFERAGLSGDPAPRREAGKNIAPTISARTKGGATQAIAFDCKAGADTGFAIGDVPGPLRGEGHGGGHTAIAFDTTQITNPDNRSNPQPDGPSHPLSSQTHPPAVVFQPRYVRNGRGAPDTVASALTSEARETGKGDSAQCVATAWAVRRLTPVECERLQAMPDGYTDVPWRGAAGAPDGPRYKALGNSMSVNVMRWIGTRIDMVDAIFAK